MAERDLMALLSSMDPVLSPDPYGLAVWEGGVLPFQPFATVAEAEGLTPLAALQAAGLVSEPWAKVSLTVHSDLAAVGLTAAFASALARAGISCNVIAGYHHDHLFVQWDLRDAALAALEALASA